MTTALLIAGLILAAVDQLRARGQSVLGWAVLLIGLALATPVLR